MSTEIEASTKAGFRLKHRTRAALDSLAEKLFKSPKFLEKLEKQAMEDPKTFVGWLVGQAPADAAPVASNALNINNLFLQAARDVSAAPALAAPVEAEFTEISAPAPALKQSDW